MTEKAGGLLNGIIGVIFIPLADQVVRCGPDIVLVDDIGSDESGLIHLAEEFPIQTYIEVEGAIDVNSWCEGSDVIDFNGMTTACEEEDGIMQLEEDILDLARV